MTPFADLLEIPKTWLGIGIGESQDRIGWRNFMEGKIRCKFATGRSNISCKFKAGGQEADGWSTWISSYFRSHMEFGFSAMEWHMNLQRTVSDERTGRNVRQLWSISGERERHDWMGRGELLSLGHRLVHTLGEEWGYKSLLALGTVGIMVISTNGKWRKLL